MNMKSVPFFIKLTNQLTLAGAHSDDKSLDKMCLEPAIESDSSAHINVGDEYQATNIPECDPKNYDYNESGSVHERLLWDTSIIKNPVDDKKGETICKKRSEGIQVFLES